MLGSWFRDKEFENTVSSADHKPVLGDHPRPCSSLNINLHPWTNNCVHGRKKGAQRELNINMSGGKMPKHPNVKSAQIYSRVYCLYISLIISDRPGSRSPCQSLFSFLFLLLEFQCFLASQDALEVMPVTYSLTDSWLALTWLMWPWWVMIPKEDLIYVTLVSDDT